MAGRLARSAARAWPSVGAGRSVEPPGPAPGAPLSSLPYAVVDVETTGGPYSRGHRMSEVAIYEVREGAIADEYHTLLNPGRRIPPRIQVPH